MYMYNFFLTYTQSHTHTKKTHAHTKLNRAELDRVIQAEEMFSEQT